MSGNNFSKNGFLSTIAGISILAMAFITVLVITFSASAETIDGNQGLVSASPVCAIGVEDCDNTSTTNHLCLAQVGRYAYPIVEHRDELGGWFWVLIGVFIIGGAIYYANQNK